MASCNGIQMQCAPLSLPAAPSAQLTIFFNGMVKVYEDVTPHNARHIIQFAGTANSSGLQFPPFLAGHLSMSRKLSLQRFLEKRKQRILCNSPYHASK